MFRLFSTFHSQLFYSLEYFLFFFGKKRRGEKGIFNEKKHSSERSKDNEQMVCSSYKKYYSAQKDQITSAN